jgi:hypothetical protein
MANMLEIIFAFGCRRLPMHDTLSMRHDIVPAIRHQQIVISSRLLANDARGVRMYVALELLRRAIVSGVDDPFYSITASRTGRLNSVFFFLV